MKKLLRLLILSVLFITLFAVAYAVLPTLVWLFGGEFKAVSQNIAYVIFGSMGILIMLGIQFHCTFDSNFYEKN
jgi:hypothetical protein